MTTTIAQAHPMPAHTARKAVVRVAAGVAVLAAVSAGIVKAEGVMLHHVNQPTTTVSYADQSTIARTLAGAWHTPATAGDFRPTASIQTADVVSVVRAVK